MTSQKNSVTGGFESLTPSLSGLDEIDWVGPSDGVRYRAPHGAKTKVKFYRGSKEFSLLY